MLENTETKTAVVGHYSTIAEAEIIRGLLESAGIDCFISNRALPDLFPNNPINALSIEIIVRETDLELAKQILKADFDKSNTEL